VFEDAVVVQVDEVIVVTAGTVSVRSRASTRTAVQAKGAALVGHFLARQAPPGWVWCVLSEGDHMRLLLHSRPPSVREAA
jgi:hypothetical protein